MSLIRNMQKHHHNIGKSDIPILLHSEIGDILKGIIGITIK